MNFLRLLSVSIGIASLPLSSLAQTVANPRGAVPSTIPNSAQKISLEQQVDTAINNARHTFNTLEIYSLALKGDQVLPYFAKYKADPNHFTRSQVSYAFARVHTPEALPTLIEFLVDPDQLTQAFAERALYCNYEPRRIMTLHSQEFKKNLLTALDRRNNDGQVILMLSAFKNDPEVINRLQSLRLLSEESKKKSDESAEQIKRNSSTNSFQPYSPNTLLKVDFGSEGPFSPSLTIALDVAMAQMGDKAAIGRVNEVIRHGTENERIFIFEAVRFVNDKQLIIDMVELLKDKTVLKSQYGTIVSASPHPSSMMYLAVEEMTTTSASSDYRVRVCDMALHTLAAKSQIDIGVPDVVLEIHQAVVSGTLCDHFPGAYRHYTDAELEVAYQRLKQFYKIP